MSRSRSGGSGRARRVYSTDPAAETSIRLDTEKAEVEQSLDPGVQSIHVRLERSGRAGKTVTVAGPLALRREDASALLARLKRTCGCGGTARRVTAGDGRIVYHLEVQGDRVERVGTLLRESGYNVRGAAPGKGRR